MPTPKPLNPQHIHSWQNWLKDLRKHYAGTHTRFTLAPSVQKDREEHYHKERERLIKAEPLERAASVRIEGQTLKIALQLALADNPLGTTVIMDKHWGAAKKLGKYLLECNRQLFGLVTIDPRAQSERRILEALERCDNCATRRQIRQCINRQTMSSDEFAKSLEALVNAGTLELFQDRRKTLYTRVLSDIDDS